MRRLCVRKVRVIDSQLHRVLERHLKTSLMKLTRPIKCSMLFFMR